MMTGNSEANDWLLAPNPNGEAKVAIMLDATPIIPWVLPMDDKKFGFKIGEPGESFSHPIVYSRNEKVVQPVSWTFNFTQYATTRAPYNSTLQWDSWHWFRNWHCAPGQSWIWLDTTSPQFNPGSFDYWMILCSRPTADLILTYPNGEVITYPAGTGFAKMFPFVVDEVITFPVSMMIGNEDGDSNFTVGGMQVGVKTEPYMLDDSAHIQKLPSHNAIPQESVRMLGGTVDSSKVREIWGKTRATAPLYPDPPKPAPTILSPEEQAKWLIANTFDEAAFYEDRSEWYINMATRDDFLKVDFLVNSETNIAELDLYMKDIIFIIQPSQHSRLKKNYMYYDIDDEPPRIQTTGVTY
jgi:hypothetical protein